MPSAWGSSWGHLWGASWGLAAVDDDTALQDILDPGENFKGVLITARADAPPVTSYYCQPIIVYPGRAKWIDVLTSWTNAQKAAHIIAVLEIPI